jgi:hypothetical protein
VFTELESVLVGYKVNLGISTVWINYFTFGAPYWTIRILSEWPAALTTSSPVCHRHVSIFEQSYLHRGKIPYTVRMSNGKYKNVFWSSRLMYG